ncbi:YcjF family protein [Agarivorans sp. Z349TD_8]|uniref:YcjF family protein n=1 Tax=Agarivorans sp. Z349TD_8 TaxID=3421434 RepID=UPI003D7CB6A4
MNPSIKPRQVLDAESQAKILDPLAKQDSNEQLAAKQVIDDQQQWQEAPDLEPIKLELQSKKSNGWLKYGVGAALAMGIGELTLSLFELWQSSPIRAGIYSAISGTIVLALLSMFIKELANLRRLKKYQKQHQQGELLLQGQGRGNAQLYCEKLAKLQGLNDSQEYLTWQNWLNENHSDAEVVSLYSETVLKPLDDRAKQAISQWSGEAAVLVAISPLAIVDMLIIFWRNIKMIEAVAKIYGVELGYFSRIKLIKSVFVNMIYAATSEVITDLGSDLLGAELTAKLSSKAAQGIGAGLLTARLGFKTMEQCRPVPWTLNNKPKTKQLKNLLLSKLRNKLSI